MLCTHAIKSSPPIPYHLIKEFLIKINTTDKRCEEKPQILCWNVLVCSEPEAQQQGRYWCQVCPHSSTWIYPCSAPPRAFPRSTIEIEKSGFSSKTVQPFFLPFKMWSGRKECPLLYNNTVFRDHFWFVGSGEGSALEGRLCLAFNRFLSCHYLQKWKHRWT